MIISNLIEAVNRRFKRVFVRQVGEGIVADPLYLCAACLDPNVAYLMRDYELLAASGLKIIVFWFC